MYQGIGTVIKGVGGLFTVRLIKDAASPSAPLDGKTVLARGRGSLRKKGELLVGDRVRVCYDEATAKAFSDDPASLSDGGGIAVEEILPRKNALIRPPMANLDVLFVTVAAATPDPVPETMDKLICIAEYNGIEPILVVTKADLDLARAARIAAVYQKAGFEVFVASGETGEGVDALNAYIHTLPTGCIAAFSGASGVGKSTLLNRLFPHLALETGELSRRIERGKNTTRSVELYPLSETNEQAYLADTPGFTMLDFARFDFFGKEDLFATFREFRPYLGECRYKKCTHTKEEGCALLAAVREGVVSRSRHKSYTHLFEILKTKKDWEKP